MSSNVKEVILEMGARALAASRVLATLSSEEKNAALLSMAEELVAATPKILEANALDLEAGREKGLSKPMLDRLALNDEKIAAIAGCIRQVAELPDPVGEILDQWERPNGLRFEQRRVPIGVIGIIFESRPNVTSDAATLCFKSGNATILKGGSEAIHSNQAIAAALAVGGARTGVPEGAIQLVPSTDRESVRHLAEMDQYLDLIVPRGGKGLIEAVVSMARMPVIKHYDGICHTFVDREADPDKAVRLVVDAKTHKPSVCNALETLLIHEAVAESLLPRIADALRERGVELRGDEASLAILGDRAVAATDEDWGTEYLDLVATVGVVADLEGAVAHINKHGSSHSDCIVTEDEVAAQHFLDAVDSACVFWNASTRFADGEEFGFGAEIGISTDKLHARGPMALRELTSYKYLIRGTGQTRG